MLHRATCVSCKGSTIGSFHGSTRSFRVGREASTEVTKVARVHGRSRVFPVFGLLSAHAVLALNSIIAYYVEVSQSEVHEIFAVSHTIVFLVEVHASFHGSFHGFYESR